MGVDLEKLSAEELVRLKKEADKALATLEARRRAEALEAAELAAQKHGYKLKDLMGGAKASATKMAKGVAQFANPADPSQTWTGKGRQPEWFKTAIANGKSRDELAL